MVLLMLEIMTVIALGKPSEPPLTEGIRKSMKSNKCSGTSPEIQMRKALREAGYPGYRLNWKKAPGKPDICYPGRHVAIFINLRYSEKYDYMIFQADCF